MFTKIQRFKNFSWAQLSQKPHSWNSILIFKLSVWIYVLSQFKRKLNNHAREHTLFLWSQGQRIFLVSSLNHFSIVFLNLIPFPYNWRRNSLYFLKEKLKCLRRSASSINCSCCVQREIEPNLESSKCKRFFKTLYQQILWHSWNLSYCITELSYQTIPKLLVSSQCVEKFTISSRKLWSNPNPFHVQQVDLVFLG